MEDSNPYLTYHAIKQYLIRTGTQFYVDVIVELQNGIREADELSASEVVEAGFPLVRTVKGDTYLRFRAPRINEDVLAVVSQDKAVKTILTLETPSVMRDSRKYRSIEKGVRETKERFL